jgi:hypothetical protein
MVKFLIALAELFSTFAAKLHNLSEEVPSESIDHEAVLDIVQDAINEGHLKLPSNEEAINAEDVYGLDRFVTEQIDTHDFDYKFDVRQFDEQTMALIMSYAFENRIDTACISWHEECREMREHMFRRYEIWRNHKIEREKLYKERVIKEYLKNQECPPSPHRLTINTDVKI